MTWRSFVFFGFWAVVLAMTPLLLVSCQVDGNDPAYSDEQTVAVTIDYPPDGAVFPPEFPPPTFIWLDPEDRSDSWLVEIQFEGIADEIRVVSPGEPVRLGEIDERCIAPTNELPRLTAEQASAHTWKPDAETWAAIKEGSVERTATITISGYEREEGTPVLSRGEVRISTSRDPVEAPIFYRDVPLMPSETLKGVIKPLAKEAVPLVAWRLRNVAEDKSRLLMEGLYSCANCHSFSADGKTMGMDLDGPQNDKGLYAILPVEREMSISNDKVVAWSDHLGKLGGTLRVGFMSQVSPDGQYVATTINDSGEDQTQYQRRKNPKDFISNYYVANFKDYRFLQVFYPTRGILAWYSRSTGQLRPLPGADDPLYVQTNAVWSPDGSYLVFSRAQAADPYPATGEPATHANDPRETRIQYDLYRIPFNGGKGGRPERIVGASQNGMSNSFPKISPDGRWIVFVQSRNGQLMRPDGQLYIIPAEGGEARRMTCNTPLMNSWHSFSPNGHWLVFSSKSRSPYTQMFLTHLDPEGNDTPAILIEDSTAANRAVNIPEFVNVAPDGMAKIEAPAAEYYRVFDSATELMEKRRFEAAAREWERALRLSPNEPVAHNNLGVSLAETGRAEEAVAHYRKALELDPKYPLAYNNLGEALASKGRFGEAVIQFRKALQVDPEHADSLSNLGAVLAQQGKVEEAIPYLRKAVEYLPTAVHVRANLAMACATRAHWQEAISHLEEAIRLTGGQDASLLELLRRVQAQAGIALPRRP